MIQEKRLTAFESVSCYSHYDRRSNKAFDWNSGCYDSTISFCCENWKHPRVPAFLKTF